MLKIKRLDIALTTKCNFTCSYCRGTPGKRVVLPYDEVIKVIDNFYEFGVRNIRLDGGEPFLYGEDIFKIIEYAENKGIEVGIFTNASCITKEVGERISKYSNLTLYVTLHILNKDTELNMTLKGLHEIAQNNINSELILIVSKKNMPNLLTYMEKVPDHHYKIIFRPIIPIGKAFQNIDEGYSALSEKDIKEFESIVEKIKDKFEKLEVVNEISKVHKKKDGYHNKEDGFVLHVNTNAELLPSFAAGTAKFLGNALDKESIEEKLSNHKTFDYLINADNAVLNRINGNEKPLAENISLD